MMQRVLRLSPQPPLLLLLLLLGVVVGSGLFAGVHGKEKEGEDSKEGFVLPSSQQYLVTDLPAPAPNDTLYAGYVPVTLPSGLADAASLSDDLAEGGELFFWLALARERDYRHAPIVVWLNGGPGCSSLVGFTFENGPFILHEHEQEDGSTKLIPRDNPWAWNRIANMLFVEQPVNTGFSFSDDGQEVFTEMQVRADFYGFLTNWLRIFRDHEFADNPIFLFGESYAGMYAPSIAYEIHVQNARVRKDMGLPADTNDKDFFVIEDIHDEVLINFRGIALGNGWVDSFIQTASYTEYAYAHGLIDAASRDAIEASWHACLFMAEEDGYLTREEIDRCGIMDMVLEAAGQPNQYDTRTYVQYTQILKPDSVSNVYFNTKQVQEALHVRGDNLPGLEMRSDQSHDPGTWTVCNFGVDADMGMDIPITMNGIIRSLLESEMYKITFYNGETDLNCNFLGTEEFLEALQWKGSYQWHDADRYAWKDGEETAGYYKTVGNLQFLIVVDSGHLMPMDQPERALDMLDRITHEQNFSDALLPAARTFLPNAGAAWEGQTGQGERGRGSSDTEGSSLLSPLMALSLLMNAAVLFVGGRRYMQRRWDEAARGSNSNSRSATRGQQSISTIGGSYQSVGESAPGRSLPRRRTSTGSAGSKSSRTVSTLYDDAAPHTRAHAPQQFNATDSFQQQAPQQQEHQHRQTANRSLFGIELPTMRRMEGYEPVGSQI